MTTQAKHDTASLALDARRVLEAVRQDAHHKEFSTRLTKHEADAFERDIDALEAGDASRTTRHHAQVAAAVHVAEARASILHLASDIRDDIKIHFGTCQRVWDRLIENSMRGSPRRTRCLSAMLGSRRARRGG